ncbi:hypothetical protein D3C83_126580 [compost metagenome]
MNAVRKNPVEKQRHAGVERLDEIPRRKDLELQFLIEIGRVVVAAQELQHRFRDRGDGAVVGH